MNDKSSNNWTIAIHNFTVPQMYIGVLLAVMGGFGHHFGQALMKYSHIKNSEKQIEYQKMYLLDPRWWICFGFYSIGILFIYSSLHFIQLSCLVPLTMIGIYSGFKYTSWYMAMKLTRKDMISFIVSIIGTCILLISEIKLINNNNNTNSSLKMNTLPGLFFLSTILFAIVLIVLNRIEKFQNVFVSVSAPSIFLALSLTVAKMSFSLYTLILALIPLLAHIHLSQQSLISYSYFTYIAIHHSLFSFFSLAYGEMQFDEFPDPVSQCLLILLGWLLQVSGLFMLVSDKVTRGGFFPDRSTMQYSRFNNNSINYEFDSDDAASMGQILDDTDDTDDDDHDKNDDNDNNDQEEMKHVTITTTTTVNDNNASSIV